MPAATCPFYTEWEARRDNVKPQWVVDLTLRNTDIPNHFTSNYNRNASKRIETGRDTKWPTTYQTVYATLKYVNEFYCPGTNGCKYYRCYLLRKHQL